MCIYIFYKVIVLIYIFYLECGIIIAYTFLKINYGFFWNTNDIELKIQNNCKKGGSVNFIYYIPEYNNKNGFFCEKTKEVFDFYFQVIEKDKFNLDKSNNLS